MFTDDPSYYWDKLGAFFTDNLGTRLVFSYDVLPIEFSYESSAVLYAHGTWTLYDVELGTIGSETDEFTGKPVSQTTGLYYSFQRWYDPEIGRFISQDIIPGDIGQPQTLNRYTYVANSPTSYIDPTGLAVETPFDIASAAYDVTECIQNPDLVNCGIAAIDVILIFVPGVPAVAGHIYRGGSFFASHADDAARVVSHFDDLSRLSNRLEDLSESTYVLNLSGDVLNRFDDLYKAGRYGGSPRQLALGQYVDQFVKSTLNNFETAKGILGRNFPDAWRQGGIIEIKPFHEGVNPFIKYSDQLNRYVKAHLDLFGTRPEVKLLLYRFI